MLFSVFDETGLLPNCFISITNCNLFHNPFDLQEPANDVRNHPIEEKYRSLKEYLDSTGD